MELYEVLKYLHISSVVVWVGGATLFNVLGTQVARANNPQEMASFGARVEWFGLRYFVPFSLLVLAFGVSMVWESEVWKFSDTWIMLGLAGIAFTIVTGAAYLGPTSGKIAKAIEGGGNMAEVTPLINRLLWVARIDLVVLFLVIADMVFRPGV